MAKQKEKDFVGFFQGSTIKVTFPSGKELTGELKDYDETFLKLLTRSEEHMGCDALVRIDAIAFIELISPAD